jgi:hypothetical protein
MHVRFSGCVSNLIHSSTYYSIVYLYAFLNLYIYHRLE